MRFTLQIEPRANVQARARWMKKVHPKFSHAAGLTYIRRDLSPLLSYKCSMSNTTWQLTFKVNWTAMRKHFDTFLKHAHALVYNTTLYYEFIMQADEE